MNLARRLTLTLSVCVTCVVVTATSYRMYREDEFREADKGRDARLLGRALAYAAEHAWDTGGEAEVKALADYATGRKPLTTIRLVWPERQDSLALPAIDVNKLQPLSRGESVTLIENEPEEVMRTYVPVEFAPGVHGALEITDPLAPERGYLWQSLATALATNLALVALCSGVVWILVSRLVRDPIHLLISQARGVGEGDLTQRVAVGNNDDLAALAIEMNRMCERLQEANTRANTEAVARALAVEQLRHADRLATVGTIASSVAHELGTPINVIEGHARLIQETTSSHDISEHILVIEAQCQRMASMIRQWLAFGRQGREVNQNCDANSAIQETIRMLGPIAQAAKVDMQAQAAGANLRVAIEFNALQQVLLNLAINSIQAMKDGGLLTFDVRESGRGPAPSSVCIRVSDTGPGIAPSLKPHVFDHFFTTKDAPHGTGLGLAIAAGIVEDYGGKVELFGSNHAGTVFDVLLPQVVLQ